MNRRQSQCGISQRPLPARVPGATAGKGFTLLEVLAALLLVAVVLPVVMAGLSQAVQMGSLTRWRSQAAALAETKLAEVIANEDWQRGDAHGQFDDTWGERASRFTWQLRVTQWQDPSMRELAVDVQWQQRSQTQQVSIATVIHAEGQ